MCVHILSSLGFTVGSGCSPRAGGQIVQVFFQSALGAQEFTFGITDDCDILVTDMTGNNSVSQLSGFKPWLRHL